MASNSHHSGTETTNSATKCAGERESSELPRRRSTSASMTRIAPSQSGKNSAWLRRPSSSQLKPPAVATSSRPSEPWTGQPPAAAARSAGLGDIGRVAMGSSVTQRAPRRQPEPARATLASLPPRHLAGRARPPAPDRRPETGAPRPAP